MMTLRRLVLVAVVAFFCWMITLAVIAENSDLVGSLAWAVVVVLMLPMDRFEPDNIIRMLKMWKGKDDV